VNLKQAAPKAPKSAPEASPEAASAPAATPSDSTLIFGIAAVVIALLSLGVQVWTMMS
jgi:predicted flap endonuclease-1-like 5' DNA nuclease